MIYSPYVDTHKYITLCYSNWTRLHPLSMDAQDITSPWNA